MPAGLSNRFGCPASKSGGVDTQKWQKWKHNDAFYSNLEFVNLSTFAIKSRDVDPA